MNTLVVKEIQLLRPVYAMAMILAIVPVWLLPRNTVDLPEALAIGPFGLGAVILALSAFGPEFGLQTFALLLTQPMERRRIWWTKITVLAGAMATVFAAWCLSCTACVYTEVNRLVWQEALTIGGTAAVVTFAGGLWTTLLLRQVTAAFWFTVLFLAHTGGGLRLACLAQLQVCV